MTRRFLKIALRLLWRNKTYSILNFLCLTFGLASAIIAVLYIMNICSYDQFHKNYNRLYEVEAMVTYFNGDRFLKEPLSASLKDVVKENIPEIESFVRIASRGYTISAGDKSFDENGIYADEEFFNMFSFPLASTGVQTVLSDINSIVISERTAKKLFETADCTGKMITLKDDQKEEVYKISGVLKDVPSQSLLQFDFVIPFSHFLLANGWANETGASACQIWGLFRENTNVSKVNSRIKDLIKKQETTLNQELFLFPLKEKILYSYAGEKRVWKEMQNVVIIGSIGFAILIIACFNFLNLAIALNIRRYREVGIKKAAGASKSSIIVQFLGETFILILTSMFFAVILVRLLLVGFNAMFEGDIHLRFSEFSVILAFILIAMFTALFSGLLPALFLSSSNPVSILKAKIVTGQSYSFLRQSLIVFQFVIPVVLIICMLIIRVQDRYMRNFDLGFEKEKLIIINSTKSLGDHELSLKTDLLSIPGIEAASFTNCIPTRGARVTNEVTWEGKENQEKLHFWSVSTDFDYNKVINIKMTAGRFFDKSFMADSACYLINNIAANVIGYKDPLGKSLTVEGKKGTVIGVFEDFHTIDLAGPLVPTIISLNSESKDNLLVRFSSGSYHEIVEKISKVYKHYETEIPFQPLLFGDLPDYSRLSRTSNLVGLAFFIALLLACLGLFGLASFTAERRTKEIGIRKVNGASNFSIMRLLLKNYSKWLIISFLIAIPLAFLPGKIFLSRFYFHSPMPIWTFFAGPLISYVFAMVAVCWQSRRAAVRNPVESLSCE